jgi:hypothetical protein
MQYMLMIIADETRAPLPAGELSGLMQAYRAFTDGIMQSGHFRSGAPLLPSPRATTVREQGGRRVLTDGPFSDAKQHIAGYYVVECKDLDEAIAIAGRIPAVRIGEAIEIRPLVPMPG